jgi:hypothetical protein
MHCSSSRLTALKIRRIRFERVTVAASGHLPHLPRLRWSLVDATTEKAAQAPPNSCQKSCPAGGALQRHVTDIHDWS